MLLSDEKGFKQHIRNQQVPGHVANFPPPGCWQITGEYNHLVRDGRDTSPWPTALYVWWSTARGQLPRYAKPSGIYRVVGMSCLIPVRVHNYVKCIYALCSYRANRGNVSTLSAHTEPIEVTYLHSLLIPSQ